jgi:hypothetical protein
MDTIVNKVAESGLLNIDLEDFYPKGKRVILDIKDELFQGIILKEKDFRTFIKEKDWSTFQDQYVAITCSVDAIIPTWAYMLLAAQLQPYAKKFVFGSLENLETTLYNTVFDSMNFDEYVDARVIIKGCGNLPVPVAAFVELTSRLRPIVKTMMYGEACSTVPLYKKAK